jgi:beta-lactamase superfamily II metal-dependent hydrolase
MAAPSHTEVLEAVGLAIEKLDVGPGDVIVLRTTRHFDAAETERARVVALQVLEAAGITDVGVLIASPDVDVTVENAGG